MNISKVHRKSKYKIEGNKVKLYAISKYNVEGIEEEDFIEWTTGIKIDNIPNTHIGVVMPSPSIYKKDSSFTPFIVDENKEILIRLKITPVAFDNFKDENPEASYMIDIGDYIADLIIIPALSFD